VTGSNGAWSNADLYAGVFPPHMLVHALSHDLDRPVMHMWDGRVLTAGQIRDLTSTYVQALQSLGIAKGTRLGVLSGNRPEVIHVGNGASLAGACLVPLHPMGSLDDYIYVIEDAGVEALVFDPSKFGDKAIELKRRLPQLKHLLSMGPAEGAVDLAALAATFCLASAARAQEAMALIVAANGSPARFTAEGRADAEPLASNATANGREENRRIEVILLRGAR
jgi:acyl-CoA synthetase (AMP-forming)/AMP-acid ligase II